MNAKEKYRYWLNSPDIDEDTKAELRSIEGNDKEIEDRFYRELEFGTGGLRGVMGAGSNRMNRYTVRKAAQGLANYIKKQNTSGKGVAIAYDSRLHSQEFAEDAALCLAANQISAYVFPSLRPTPMLSFAVRKLGCTAGIVITASHNPREYNGYKVYWEDGAQITPPRDAEIIAEVNAVTDFAEALSMTKEAALAEDLYHVIGSEVDDQYMEAVKSLVIHPETIREQADRLRIVYTPLHGSGNLWVRRILKELGFHHVYVVEEQELPDGSFPTLSYPNPEDPKAFELALKLSEEKDADLVLATDPDADRLGIYVKDRTDGKYKSFTGNMTGILLLDYILSQRKSAGTLPLDGAVVTTIVSGKMSAPLSADYGMSRIETLTGFKYIGEQIKFFEQTHQHHFVFGYEESYGCLLGTCVRDKDAVMAVMALCDAAAWDMHCGRTLLDHMRELFNRYGWYREKLVPVTLKGAEGAEKIRSMMDAVRSSVPEMLGGRRVLEFRDYKEGRIQNMETGEENEIDLPQSNVLYFRMEGDSWCCIRPSGTEPKIKFYIGVCGESQEDAAAQLGSLTAAIEQLAE